MNSGLILIAVGLIYFKPWYGFLILPIFFLEYVFLLKNINDYRNYSKKNDYNIIKIEEYEYDGSLLNCWIQLNKVKSYERFYKMLLKKKLDLKTIAYASVIIILGVPVRLITLIDKLRKCKGSLYDRVYTHYIVVYENNKNLKIEFVNKKHYLNCLLTLKQLVKQIKTSHPKSSKQQIYDFLKTSKHQMDGYETYENDEKNRVMVHFSKIITPENYTIPKIHPIYVGDLIMKRFGFKNETFSLHATSNIKFEIKASQIKGKSIQELTKPNSSNPGSIITINPKVEIIKPFKPVSKIKIESILINTEEELMSNFGMEYEIDNRPYLEQKKKDLLEMCGTLGKGEGDLLMKSMEMGEWKILLTDVNDQDIIKAIEEEYLN